MFMVTTWFGAKQRLACGWPIARWASRLSLGRPWMFREPPMPQPDRSDWHGAERYDDLVLPADGNDVTGRLSNTPSACLSAIIFAPNITMALAFLTLESNWTYTDNSPRQALGGRRSSGQVL